MSEENRLRNKCTDYRKDEVRHLAELLTGKLPLPMVQQTQRLKHVECRVKPHHCKEIAYISEVCQEGYRPVKHQC